MQRTTDAKHRSTAKPAGESFDHLWICREDFGIERNQSFKGDHGSAQFSLCCTSTAMPDDDSQDRHPAFSFAKRIRKAGDERTVGIIRKESPRVIIGGDSPAVLAFF